MRDALEKFMDQEGLHTFEGRRGLINFAKICQAIGYKDHQHSGQLEQGVCTGDIVEFLEDNPGAFEALITWMCKQNVLGWKQSIKNLINDEDEDDEE